MKSSTALQCDLLVIGSGMAGMTAAARAAYFGVDTILTGSSAGFYLTSGLLDLLGVYPAGADQTLSDPWEGLKRLTEEIPLHPYSRVTATEIEESLEFVRQILNTAGLAYHCGRQGNLQVLTAAGTFKPSFLVPATMVKADQVFHNKKIALLLVDFNGLKGYSAKQIASELKQHHREVSVLNIEVPQLSGDFNVTRMAELLETPLFVETLGQAIVSGSHKAAALGLPAVCGINPELSIVKQLETLTGMDCFEIPGLPPSIPGLRLKNAFEKHLARTDVRVFSNSTVAFQKFENDHVLLEMVSEKNSTPVRARGVILATGRFQGGGLKALRGLIQEPLFQVPVYQPAQRSLWYNIDLFAPTGHPINQAGLLSDSCFRPVDKTEAPVFDTLYAAGSLLSHNDWVRLKSGAGVSCVSAVCAVNHFCKKTGR